MQSVSISIIVPFYNVENCVTYCIESLLCQTYDNYEIICVDDGSTDSTGMLLDSYLGFDRVKIFHKINGGLSDARNYGIQMACGEYITFVDGDDVVSPYYLEHMVYALSIDSRALIIGGFRKVLLCDAFNNSIIWEKPNASLKELSQAECIYEFLHNKVTESAWGKLAPKSAYSDGFFPVGKLYEDLYTFPALILQFEQIIILQSDDYGYVLRGGSIVRAKNTKIRQAKDYLDAVEALKALSEDEEQLAYRRTLAFMRMRPILKAVVDEPNEAKDLMKKELKETRKNRGILLKDEAINFEDKARICVYIASPPLHDILLEIIQRKEMYWMRRRRVLHKHEKRIICD